MFVIVRHGNTFAPGETLRRIGARTDLPLTGEGERQASALGVHFAGLDWRFSRVLASPQSRTRKTADLILEHQSDAPLLELCDWLREIDHGPDENQTEEQVLARIGRKALARWDSWAEPPPDWIVDADARRSAWRGLFDEEQSGATLIVTSNGAARFALFALSTDPALVSAISERSGLKLPTGSYGVIQRRPDGTFNVPVWGKRP